MASGESAAEQAAAKRAAANNYRLQAERAERAADEWSRGAQGEVALAQAMGPLSADGYYRLDDRRLPGSNANIDHVLVGPAGVFVVDAKNWSGRLRVEGKSLWQGDRRRDDHLERVRVQAVNVSTVIEDALGRRVEVRPAICFTGEARLPFRTAVDRVHLVNRDELIPFIRGLERRLDQGVVDEVMTKLLARLPPRTAPAATVREQDTAVGGTTDPVPAEEVLFLVPWTGHGHRRLYVKTADGSETGYLDVKSGEVHSADEGWSIVLARLLPHYVTEAGADQTASSRGAFRRFIDVVLGRPNRAPAPPIVAAYHWKKFGKERLYVSRIDPAGAKQELGHVDLLDGKCPSKVPGSLPILEYCGNQFRRVSDRNR